MADIQKDKIKLMASQVLADTEDGGGQMTSDEIVDGNVNNLFPDISRLDRTYGRVSLRKAYLSIQTDNRATYYGAHVALTEQAADPLVSTLLFTTENWFDMRENCQDRIEQYLVKGPQYPCAVYGNLYQGTKVIVLHTYTSNSVPEINDVLVIRDANDSSKEQYIRLLDVSTESRSFMTTGGDTYEKQIITLTIGKSLEYDFQGSDPERGSDYSGLDTKIFTTAVADAAKYYGVKRLNEPATAGELQIKTDGIKAPIVPASQSATPIVDYNLGTQTTRVLSKDPVSGPISKTRNYSISSNGQMYIGEAVTPGSFSIGSIINDDGQGNISNGTDNIGSISYDTGIITFQSDIDSSSGSATWVYEPAFVVTGITATGVIEITESNRQFSYVFQCHSLPVKQTMSISFMSGERWYTIYDMGDGQIKSAATTDLGSGIVNYDTGSVSLSLKYLPDVNTNIIFYWGDNTDLFALDESTSQTLNVFYEFDISTAPTFAEAEPGTFSITYSASSIEITDVDGDGILYQGGTDVGYVSYMTGKIRISPTEVPGGEAVFAISWGELAYSASSSSFFSQSVTGTLDNDDISYTVAASYRPIKPGTMNITVPDIGYYEDDGNGNLQPLGGEPYAYFNGHDCFGSGTINYDTGEIILTAWTECVIEKIVGYEDVGSVTKWVTEPIYGAENTYDYPTSGDMKLSFYHNYISGGEYVADLETATYPRYKKYRVNPDKDIAIKKESLYFTYNGDYVFVDTFGNLVSATDPLTDDKTIIGDFNETTGELTITDDVSGSRTEMQVVMNVGSGLLNLDRIGHMIGRAPGYPITAGSLTVQATDNSTGELLTATAATDGTIADTGIEGELSYINGSISLYFGDWVPDDATAQGALWYDAENNDGAGNVWKPRYIQPDEVLLNCVVESYLPLDVDLLGLDPVRLPVDGKIRIFRTGDVILIHHTEIEVVTPSVGTTVALSRDNVNLIELYDNNGVYVSEVENYSVDLAAGEITFEDPLDLSSYTSPFQALHRREDMVLGTEVQVTGHISISQPLQHDYPAEETLVSSVLPIGDVQARVYNLFTDSSWDDEWSNDRQHGPTTAQYNIVDYPIVVTNESSVKERFALIFTASNTVDIVGEHLGVIASGVGITTKIEPTNATGLPYFTIRPEGWGSGWNIGEVLRFNIDAGNYPVWFCRTTQQGPATENSDQYCIQIRGDSS